MLNVITAFVVFSLVSNWHCTSALPTGAPTAACGTLTPQHLEFHPTDCQIGCAFFLLLREINGTHVESDPIQNTPYKCGSQHKFEILSLSNTARFRGFVIQSRESTEAFDNTTAFVGEFTNPDPDGDWQIWNCDGPSATHTNNNVKHGVFVEWTAPDEATTNVTFWFSVVREFTGFHVQLKGPNLPPDPSSCDINECDDKIDDCVDEATCENTDGSFTCTCPDGYIGDGRESGSGCQDVNECDTGTDDCDPNAICKNIDGSFTCTCPDGYIGDGRQSGSGCEAENVNECKEDTDDCVKGATCIDTDDGFECKCARGFIGDGRKSGTGCRAVDCGRLTHPSCGRVRFHGTTYGHKAWYTCNYGYYLYGGSRHRVCQSNGYWSGSAPRCVWYIGRY